MKTLEVIIQEEGVVINQPVEGGATEFVSRPAAGFGGRVADFCARTGSSPVSITLYVAEHLLFYKTFQLPAKTGDLKEAIQYQLSMLTPFDEDSLLYNFTTVRGDDGYRVTLCAAQRQIVDPWLLEIAEAGYAISGLFPESQRYVNRSVGKDKWVLVVPGRFAKALIFSGPRLDSRLLCQSEPAFSDLATPHETEAVYHLAPPAESRYLDAGSLLAHKPLLKEFNMLPASYRRPDYFRIMLISLLALNLAGLLGLAGLKEYRLISLGRKVDAEISAIMPQVKEMNSLSSREQKLNVFISRMEGIGTNPDILTFLDKLTRELPRSSYLDQLRLDKKKNAFHLQGYTDDIGELTAKLQSFGEAKLQSTSRRRNKTYFQVEITLP